MGSTAVNLANHFFNQGENNGTVLVATLNFHYRMTHGLIGWHPGDELDTKPTHAQAIDHLNSHKSLRDAVRTVGSWAREISFPNGALAAAYYEMATPMSWKDAWLWWRAIRKGTGEEGSPEYILYRRLQAHKLMEPSQRDSVEELAAVAIMAWNDHLTGAVPQIYGWRDIYTNPQPFPRAYNQPASGMKGGLAMRRIDGA